MQFPLDAKKNVQSEMKPNQTLQNTKQSADMRFQIISWGHWFALFNVLFCLVLASRYLFIIDWPHTLWGRIYAFVSWIGHFSFLVFALYLLIIFPLSFLLRNPRTLKISAVSIATIGLTVMLVDQQVFHAVNLHLNFLVWDLLIEPSYNTNTHEWQLFFAIMPLIFLLQMLYANWSWLKLRSLQRQGWGKWIALFFVSCFMATHLIYAWADAYFYRPITMQKANYPISYPMTARTFLENYGLLNAEDYQSRLMIEPNNLRPDVNYPLNKITVSPIHSVLGKQDDSKQIGSKQGYNIALLVFETLDQNLLLNLPSINEFTQSAVSFNEHFSDQNPDFSLEYGISPIFSHSISAQKTPSQLNDALNLQGYQRKDFVINFDAVPHNAITSESNQPLSKVELVNKRISDDISMSKIFSYLAFARDHDNKPWFLHVNLPVFKAGDDQIGFNKQNDEQQRFESSIAKLLATLYADPNTVIILTAKNNLQTDHTNEKQAVINPIFPQRVPLIIRWPDVSVDIPTEKLTTHQDIQRTILERILRVQNPPSDYSQGEDIFYPVRQNNWWVDGNNDEIIVQTAESTVLLKHNQYEMWSRSKIDSTTYSKPLEASKLSLSLKDEKTDEFRRQQLGYVLQALMDIQRFWSD